MEELPGRWEYMRTFLGSHVPLEDDQHLLQRLSGEVDSNISIFGLHLTFDQAKNLAPHAARIKTTNKMICYKVCQVR